MIDIFLQPFCIRIQCYNSALLVTGLLLLFLYKYPDTKLKTQKYNGRKDEAK